MKKLLLGAAASIIAIAAPASAATFVNVGDSVSINFGGTDPGTSASLIFTMLSENSSNNEFTFSYALTNTSNTTINPTGRLRSFGFDDINADTNVASTTATNAYGFNNTAYNANFPDGLGNREFCFSTNPGGCNGGAIGIASGQTGTGTIFLNYNGSGMTQLTLDNFAVRYQSLGLNSDGSGTGTPITTAVPEPATWAMMILGFSLVGGAMRQRKANGDRTRVAFA